MKVLQFALVIFFGIFAKDFNTCEKGKLTVIASIIAIIIIILIFNRVKNGKK